VAFTDHLDFTTWTDGDQIGAMDLDPHRYARMHLLDIGGYLATLDDCRQRFPELRILSGVEIGEAHLWAASAAATVAKAGPGGPDRILGSLHAIPHEGRLRAADDLFRQMERINRPIGIVPPPNRPLIHAKIAVAKSWHWPSPTS